MAARPHLAAAVIYDPALPPTIPPGMTMGEHRRIHAAHRPQESRLRRLLHLRRR